MVFRFTTSAILALIILSSLAGAVNVPHREGTNKGLTPTHLPLAAVNRPQRTIDINVLFPRKRNSSSPTQILSLLSNLNSHYNEDSYGTVSFKTDITPLNRPSWSTLS